MSGELSVLQAGASSWLAGQLRLFSAHLVEVWCISSQLITRVFLFRPPHRYDWSQLTTVAWNEDPALLCAAHAAGARVVLDGRFDPAAVLHSAEARTAWVAAQLGKARQLHLDGVNFDLVGSGWDGFRWVGWLTGAPWASSRMFQMTPGALVPLQCWHALSMGWAATSLPASTMPFSSLERVSCLNRRAPYLPATHWLSTTQPWWRRRQPRSTPTFQGPRCGR